MSGLANLQFGPAQQNLANSPTMGPLFALWADQEQKNRMQQQSQAIQNNEYQNIQDALAAHQAQAMDNPNDIDVIRRGKLGEAFSKEATGKYDQGTVQSRIDTTLAENKNKISTAQTEQMMHEIDKATAAMQTNPQLGISAIPDPDLRKKVAELSQKGMHPMQVLQKFSDHLKSNLANSPKFMADANLKTIEGNNKMNEQALQNQGALNVANVKEAGDNARHTDTTTRETVRANSALIANLQRENKDLSDQVGMIQILDPKGTNKEYQAKAVSMASRIKENQRIMSAIRNNMKQDYVPPKEEAPTIVPTKEIVTKSGKRVTVESR